MTLEITLAGPCSIATPQGVIPAAALGGPSAAVVLARLAVGSGRPVSREDLADALWDDPPRSWQPALRNVIARLRAALPVEMALATVGERVS